MLQSNGEEDWIMFCLNTSYSNLIIATYTHPNHNPIDVLVRGHINEEIDIKNTKNEQD